MTRYVEFILSDGSVINTLLSRQIYPHDAKLYKHLMTSWVSWAVLNDIPCQNLDGLPGAQRCVWKGMARKWVASKLGFISGK